MQNPAGTVVLASCFRQWSRIRVEHPAAVIGPGARAGLARRAQSMLTVWLLLGVSATAVAQTASDPRGYVALKGGANHEAAEDGLVATTAAGGIAAGLSLSPAWTTEFEVWLPAYIRDSAGDPKHRDVQFSVSLVRSFSAGGLRPYVLGGFSAARTVSFLTACVADRLPCPPVAGAQPAPTIVSCSEPGVY